MLCDINLWKEQSPQKVWCTVKGALYAQVSLCRIYCRTSTNWRFKFVRVIIPAITMARTINSNSVLLMCVASAGRYESLEHVQKMCVPSANNFHSCLWVLKTSYVPCHTAYVLYSSHSLYSGCSNCILGHSYMTVGLGHQKILWMELEDCCKVDIRVNSPLSSFGSRFATVRLGHYTWRVDSYIILTILGSYLFVRVKYE